MSEEQIISAGGNTAVEKTNALAVPGEWVVKKLLGPTFDEIGGDLALVYKFGRDRIIDAAKRKVLNIDDGSSANLRVTRDVFWNGAFTDDAVCAEYFGGVLASSRSIDGKDDGAVYYVDIIKSMSAKQLYLHYIIYNSLNKLLVASQDKHEINVGDANVLATQKITFSTVELINLGLNIDTDLEAIFRKGLINGGKKDVLQKDNFQLPYCEFNPTTLGIQLFAISHNRLLDWRTFPKQLFGSVNNISLPKFYAHELSDLADVIMPKK